MARPIQDHGSGILSSPQMAGKNMVVDPHDKRQVAARKALMEGRLDEAAAIANRVAQGALPWAMYVLAVTEWFRGRWMRSISYTVTGQAVTPEGANDARTQVLLGQIAAAFGSMAPELLRISPRPKLSVCIIARDEERCIERCLRSVLPIADEIVLVDTGSVDDTVAIATRLGAKVHHFTWINDFAAARNAAVTAATGDWVLSIDADEWLEEISYGPLRASLSDPSCIYMPLVRQLGGSQSFANARLFPRPAGNWQGRLHENIQAGNDYLAVRLSALIIMHDGSLPEVRRSKSKMDRNFALMQEMRQEGGTASDMVDLFEGLQLATDPETHEEAIVLLKKVCYSLKAPDTLGRLGLMTLATLLTQSNRLPEALECAEFAEKIKVHGLWTYYIKARIAYHGGLRDIARDLARQGLAARDEEGPLERMRSDLVAIRNGTFPT